MWKAFHSYNPNHICVNQTYLYWFMSSSLFCCTQSWMNFVLITPSSRTMTPGTANLGKKQKSQISNYIRLGNILLTNIVLDSTRI